MRPNGLLGGAALVGAVFGFYADAFALVNEERDADVETSFHGGGFVDVIGGIAFYAFRGFGNSHDHGEGELNIDDDAIGDHECVELALDEVVFDAFDEIFIDDHVIVGFRVEEVVALGVFVGVFVSDFFQVDAVHGIVGSQA